MSQHRSAFMPPRWLRSPHLQSVLSSSPVRAIRARRRLHGLDAAHEAVVLEAGEGVRLQGVHSLKPGIEPRGLVVLLHGWEGSVDSNYMRLTAARLLGEPPRPVAVRFLDPILHAEHEGRRRIASLARARIEAAMAAG